METVAISPFIVLFLIALIILIFWAIKSRSGRWVLGISIFGVLLLGIAVFFLRISAGRIVTGPPIRIQASSGFQGWQRSQVITPEASAKPWVDTQAGSSPLVWQRGAAHFELQQPGPDGSIAGYSQLVATQELALAEARERLKEQLRALVLEKMWQRPVALDEGSVGQALDLALRSAEELLASPGVESDRFIEGVTLPASGETSYRAAVKAQMPDNWASQAAEKAAAKMRAAREALGKERENWAWTGFYGLVLALAIFLLYTFLNASTKGHLSWTLRIVSLLAFVLLCVGLLILRRHL